jgi:hypothetical protein
LKAGYTDINMVLDRSGSMESIKTETINGVNTFLEKQKELPGSASFTLAQFDNYYEVVHGGVDIQFVPPLTDQTFFPRGTTALWDAIGRTIVDTGKRLESMPEAERPEKVIFVIMTDGFENASQEYKTADTINRMITHQRETYNWEFVFLGANQDAIAAAQKIGITRAAAMTYGANTVGVKAVMDSLNANVASYRSGGIAGQPFAFNDEDRKKQQDAGVK